MRLEEWQKWLDSQFLDEQDVLRQVAESQTEPVSPAAVEPPLVLYDPPASSMAPSPLRNMASDTETPMDEDDVPSLERYLPFLRQNNPSVPHVMPTEPPVEETEPPPSATPLSQVEQTPVAQEEKVSAQAVVAENTKQDDPEPAHNMRGEVPSITPTEDDLPPRRYGISHRRARHARNTPSIEIAQEMNPEKLWSLVPRHIQTLVSLGSDEVTQNSYKRSFKESRIELIQHLLDPSLSLEETARLLNVCPTTVRRYTNRGLLTHKRTAGDQRRFRLSDVLAFLEAQSRAQHP